MRRLGGPAALISTIVAAFTPAAAQASDPAPLRLELPAGLSLPPLYPNERLRLSFPIRPLRFSFSEVRPIGLGASHGPTPYFVAESVWLDTGRFSLRTQAASVEGIGLDCAGVTCAPAGELSLSAEARLSLGAFGDSRVVPETYVFSRYEQLSGAGGGFTRPGAGGLQLGWGGLLDL